jgi:adenylate cyclase
VTALIALGTWAASAAGWLDWLENRTADVRARNTLDGRADKSIVIIDIDNASFNELTKQMGRWPWTRRVWTELVRYVEQGQPRLMLFDTLFSGTEEGADAGFAEALRASGNVLLPFAFVGGEIETEGDVGAPPAAAALPAGSVRTGVSLKRDAFYVNKANPVLAGAKTLSGSILWSPDADGITRRLPIAIRYDGRDWATLWLAARRFVRGGENPQMPLDARGDYVVRWHGDTLHSYERIPLWEMICSIYPSQCDESVKKHKPEDFAGKIVFVGATAAGSYEVRPTAVSETAPGVFILATALDNLLHNEGIREAPVWLNVLVLLAAAIAPAWTVVQFRTIIAPLAITVGFVALYTGVAFWLYTNAWMLAMGAPLVATALSFTGNTAWRYVAADRELSRTRGTLERYVSPQLVRYVMDNLDSFNFKGEKRVLTIFFSDIRSFTTLTEKSDPAELLAQLNEYLEAMTDIIFRYDGIVDKFIGDGIMAHWGAFTPDKPNARLAARASLDMMARLKEMNTEWAKQEKPALDIGIGLNTAQVIFGNVGTGKKADFTAIGDGVNLASRLEGANKEYKTHVIISDTTRAELGETAEVRSLGSIVVKGKTVPVEIFELVGLRE